MRNYFFNILISLLVCAFVGVLTFLIGREGATAGAITAGVATGIVSSLSYCFGGFMNEDDGKFNGMRLLAMLIAGIIGGALGGGLIGIG